MHMDINMIPGYLGASLDLARDDLKIFLDAKKEMNEIEYKEEVSFFMLNTLRKLKV